MFECECDICGEEYSIDYIQNIRWRCTNYDICKTCTDKIEAFS